jgi:hypothetical protein
MGDAVRTDEQLEIASAVLSRSDPIPASFGLVLAQDALLAR